MNKKIYAERLDTSKINEKIIQLLTQDLREFWLDMGEDLEGAELINHYADLASVENELRRFRKQPLSKLIEAFEKGLLKHIPGANWEGLVIWDDIQFFSTINHALNSLSESPCKFSYPDCEASMTYEERERYESNQKRKIS